MGEEAVSAHACKLEARPESLPLVGASAAFQRMMTTISAVAEYSAPVLLQGETGTGKEMVARAIHYLGKRSNAPFAPLNCGAYNDDLLVSELFGHERGAFTDAKQARTGLVAVAESGSLFLDEVDSLSPRSQVTLLRFLQDMEYRPIGAVRSKTADVRVIAASNRPLSGLIAEGRFREDLYYRLDILSVFLPPLRLRSGDLELLSEHFLRKFAVQYGTEPKTLHPETVSWMEGYAWPGNVRELENYLHRAFALTRGPTIYVPQVKGDPISMSEGEAAAGGPAAPPTRTTEQPIDPSGSDLGTFRQEKERAIYRFEQTYVEFMLRACNGNVSQAARRAGKDRRTFARLIEKYAFDRALYR